MPSYGTWVIYSLHMAMRGQTNHTVAAMRTALVGQHTLRFDAMSTIGPAPVERSVIESVTVKGREILVQWDDGIVLSTALRFSGEWHLYRTVEMWRKETYRARVVMEVEGWVAVCFDAPIVEIANATRNRVALAQIFRTRKPICRDAHSVSLIIATPMP